MTDDIFIYQTGQEPREWLTITFVWLAVALVCVAFSQIDFAGWPVGQGPTWAGRLLAGVMLVPVVVGIKTLEWRTE